MKHIKKRDDLVRSSNTRLVKIVITNNDRGVRTYDNWEDLPKKIENDVSCSNRQLVSLKGGPVEIIGDFECSDNKLKNLEGSPRVTGNYLCNNNNLTNLKGISRSNPDVFDCSNNKLTSLKNGPAVTHDHYTCNDNKLTSLKGSPDHIYGEFNCSDNNLKNFEGGPIEVDGIFVCYNNPIESLKGLPQKVGRIHIDAKLGILYKELYTEAGILKTEKEFERLVTKKPAIAKYIIDLCSKGFRDKYAKTIKGIDQFDFFGDD